MEKNIFKFGNSSLAIIVPKKWTEKHGVKAGSSITVNEDSAGNLIFSAHRNAEVEAVKIISRSTDPYFIWRWVGLYYRFGINKLELVSKDGFSPEQISALKDQIEQYSPGFEIMNQTAIRITVEDLTKQKDMDVDRMISRMRSLVLEGFREIITGEYETMTDTEALLNRFYQLCLRYINIVQPPNMLKYFRAVESMEEIGDLLTKIAKEYRYNKTLNPLLVRSQEAFSLSKMAFEGDEKAISSIYELKKELQYKKRGKIGRGEELIEEILKYINYIAEFGLTVESGKE